MKCPDMTHMNGKGLMQIGMKFLKIDQFLTQF